MVVFVCGTCRDYNKQNLGIEGFEIAEAETESLSDAVRDHVMFGHDVWIEYREE